MNRYLLLAATCIALLLAACAPAATPAPAPAPTLDAMMQSGTPTADAMMANQTPTPEAMMQNGTPTSDAMMTEGTGTPEAMMNTGTPTPEAMMESLPNQVTAPHFVASTPKQGDQLATVPAQLLINFDSALQDNSSIAVTKDGKPITVGKTTLGDNKLSMSATLPSDAGDGVYLVKYKACLSGQTCPEGQFAFTVDSKMK